MSLDGFSMHPLVAELNHYLAGSRIDKISQPNKQTVLLVLRQPGQSFTLHISINPQNPTINIIQHTLENPPEPPIFCMVLRKQIEGGRLAQIRQHGLDRMILLDIDIIGTGGILLTKSLVIELMGKYSNMILIHENRIIDSLRKVGRTNSRVRLVLPGHDYSLPPNQDKLNILTASAADFLLAIKASPMLTLAKAIIHAGLGLGPVTAKELAFCAGLPANILVKDLEESDFSAVGTALQEIIAACRPDQIQPTLILGENKKLLAVAAFPLHIYPNETALTFSTMSELLDYSTKLCGQYTLPDKERFQKLIHMELARAQNKAEVLREEFRQSQNAVDFKIRADNLMTYQYQLTDYADAEVQLPDIYSETGELITISLDKRLTVIQNMQSYYHKYDKLKRAQNLLQGQIAQCLANIAYLASIESSLESSATLAEINEIKAELISGGYLHEKQKKKMGEKPSLPFKFLAPDGSIVLVGKNNYQNDKLTFKTAHHNDVWLHTKDIPGSHVIIRCDNAEPEQATILFAASLAAHFSKAQNSSKIPVDYTRCRHVKKPAGAKPGFVIFTNQKTVYITPDEHALAATLAHNLNA